VDINLSRVFLLALTAVGAVFALLCYLKGKLRGFRFFGDSLRFLCIQALISLTFLLVYAFFVKNGQSPVLSDVGVAFIPLTIGAYWAAWGLGALSPSPTRLLLPFGYSVFLFFRYFTAGEGLGFFGYAVFNPPFAFIGSRLFSGPLKTFGALSALVPLFCAVIGRGFGVKMIDKKGKI